MQEVCSVIDPLIKTESLIPLGNQQMNPNTGPPQQNGQHNVLNQPPKLGANCDKTRAPENAYWMPTETGFINSQPSMAEFLTHLGPDSSPKMDQTPYGNTSEDPVPEYPWMKEKKTARKGNAQSKFRRLIIIAGLSLVLSISRLSIWSNLDLFAFVSTLRIPFPLEWLPTSFRCLTSLKSFKFFIAIMEIYVLRLISGSASFLRHQEVSLINYFVYLWRGKDQTIEESVKILITNLLFKFICQTAKTRTFEQNREERRKKCLLSDRSPSSGQINDFSC